MAEERVFKIDPGEQLSAEEREFCVLQVYANYRADDAYRAAYHISQGTSVNDYVRMLKESRPVKTYLEYLQSASDRDMTLGILRRDMISGDVKERRAAADGILKLEGTKGKHQEGAEAWTALMHDIGAEIVIPNNPNNPETVMSFASLVKEGHGYVRLPFSAKIELLRRAGAPWNAHDPDASLSELQREVLAREERFKITHGGSGLGKSALGACEVLCVLLCPWTEIAIVAATYAHCGDEFEYVFEGFRRLFPDPSIAAMRCVYVNRSQQHQMEIQTVWGSRVRIFSTDREEGNALLGKEFDLIVFGEGAQVKEDVYQRKAVRALNRRIKRLPWGYYRQTGRAIMNTTPDGFSGASSCEWDRVMKQTRNKPEKMQLTNGANYLESAYLREASALENPAYSKEAYDYAKKHLPADIFAEQFQGKRVRRTGLIFKEYDDSRDVVNMPAPEDIWRMRLSAAADTGKHFSFGLWGLDQDHCFWRLGEVVSVEESIDTNMESVKKLLLRVLGPAYGTDDWERLAAAVDIWPIDPRSQHKQEWMDGLGIACFDAEMPVLSSIDTMRRLLGDRKVKIVEQTNTDPLEAIGFRYEAQNYTWRREKSSGEGTDAELQPVKKHDHSMDEARYGVIPLLEQGPKDITTTPDRTAREVWEEAQGLVGLGQMMRQKFMKGEAPGSPLEAFRNVHGM